MIEKYLAHYSNKNKYEITRNIHPNIFSSLIKPGKGYSRTNDELFRHTWRWEQTPIVIPTLKLLNLVVVFT